MSKITFILFSLVFSAMTGYSTDTLRLQDFLEVIHENHPLIKNANLFDEYAEAYRVKGKGALDPKLQSDYHRKKFGDVDYYTIWQSELKVPTKLPIDLSVGYESNDGTFLANDDSVPQNGLLYGTVNITLLRGLLFDDQRFQLQLADLNGVKSRLEKDILIREIVYQAVSSYIDWSTAHYIEEVYEEYFDLVSNRHQNILSLFFNGDIPAIDTIESKVNLNTAEKSYLEISEKLVSKEQKLNLFIWNDEDQPLEIGDNVYPSKLDDLLRYLEKISFILDPIFNNDPSIRKVENEIEIFELAMRLDKEQLKPQLDLKYNTIVDFGKEDFDPSFSLNDYKFGVSFEYAILNRKTKGEIRLAEAMIDQKSYDSIQYEETLSNKYVELTKRQSIQLEILDVINEKINNSQALYEAEDLKFGLGESSIFLLNQRERKLVEAKTEQIKSYLTIGQLLAERYYLKLGQN